MSKPDTQLSVAGLSEYTVALSEAAAAQRQELLENAGLIINISSEEEQREAVAAAANLKAFSSGLEKCRKVIKDPLLRAGELLDKTAKAATANVDKECKRIEGLLSDWHKAQQQKREEALREQQRIAEAARLERERKEKEEAARLKEIEDRRLAAEEAAKNAKSKKDREAAAAEAARLAEQQEEEQFAKSFETPEPEPVFTAPPEVVKPSGAQVKPVIKFEVVDIKALYAAYPHLVELTPKVAQINYLLATPETDIHSIPGIRAWEDTVVSVRGSSIRTEALPFD
jgi:hypothetical protein